ncbi:DUF4235 domain-containing protein [Pengzhenrongella sicca]|uniref:DUF4235 domain-containing protein n=1 Tax=Pengzhenrongella sicca TaxID=2819238 RepID=A0A8A4ZFL9_9MICO|nr:DUF4235 domain-containing protein [Pengzhenrongella sicca]QTE29336.1 DUF4235 domain-containing protein [Pengzhenrongella sicca]
MAEQSTQTTISKIVGALAAVAAAWVAQKIVATAWQAASGHTPPKPDDDGDAGLAEVAAAAMVTGAIVSLVRVLATRGTARKLR